MLNANGLAIPLCCCAVQLTSQRDNAMSGSQTKIRRKRNRQNQLAYTPSQLFVRRVCCVCMLVRTGSAVLLIIIVVVVVVHLTVIVMEFDRLFRFFTIP